MSTASPRQLVITVLGSGTSQGVPMIGCKCPVCRSTDPRDKRTRSSLFFATPDFNVLLDTTPDLRQQALRENLDRVDAVVFTHPHADHLMGFDDLRRFCDLHGGPLPIYGSAQTLEQVERIFFYAFNPKKNIPGYVHVIPHVVTDTFTLGELDFTPLPLPHGAVTTNGYLVSYRGRKLLAYLNDCSDIAEPIRARVRGVEVVILDALREGATTHLTVARAVEAALDIGAPRSFLTHQTHERSHVDRAAQLPPGVDVSYDGMQLTFALD